MDYFYKSWSYKKMLPSSIFLSVVPCAIYILPEHITVHLHVTDEKCLSKHDWLHTNDQKDQRGCYIKSLGGYFRSLSFVVICPWQVEKRRPLKDLSGYYSCIFLSKTGNEPRGCYPCKADAWIITAWDPIIPFIVPLLHIIRPTK